MPLSQRGRSVAGQRAQARRQDLGRGAGGFGRGAQRQQPADRLRQALREDLAQARARLLVGQLAVERIDVDGQAAFGLDVDPRVFVAGADGLRAHAQAPRQRLQKALGVFGLGVVGLALVGQQRGVVPHRLAVGAPEQAERPARQLFARVPLALAQVHEAARRVAVLQALQQIEREAPLGGPQRGGVPFGAVAVVEADEGGLAAHGQAHVAGLQLGVHLVAQPQNGVPLRVAVGQGDARRFEEARDAHVVAEPHLGRLHHAFDGRGGGGLGRAGQRDVAFAGQQAGGGV